MTEDNKADNALTANVPSTANISTWRGLIETVSRIVVGLIALAYVLGLLILNFHVRKYGIYYLNFLQIEYIMVGMLWAFLVGSMCCLLLVLWHMTKQIYETRKTKAIFGNIFSLLAVAFAGYTSLIYVLNVLTETPTVRFSGFWRILWALAFACMSIFNLGTKVMDLKGFVFSEKSQREESGKFARLFDMSYHTIVIIVALSVYANSVFSKLSPTFGGGKPQNVEFLIKTDERETVKAIGFQLAEDSRTIGPLEVVFEAPEFFLISPPAGLNNERVRAIRLNKDLIDAAFYLGSK